jgi:NAD(P)H-hydrate epimerase
LGNNGGHGFVAARFLSEKNDVTVYLVGTPQHIQSEEALKNWNILRYTAVNKEFIKDTKDISIPAYDITVDALLGTGITGDLREPYKTVVETLNLRPGAKVAVDIPTGYKTATSFAAERTISMHYPKTDDCIPVTIGVPHQVESLVGPGDVKFLNRRRNDSHKGDNGRVLIVGGSPLYHGAPIYAGLAASILVDLVYIACPHPVAPIIKGSTPDIIVHALSADFLVPEDIPRIVEVASSCDSVLVGPGLGTHEETLNACCDLLSCVQQKVVVDADGLKALKGHTDLLCDTMVLTPHSHEYAMLFGTHPVEAVATIVLKGPTDIISNGVTTKYNHTGNAGMTTGGTGDILAGLIAGFAAVNNLFQASCAGAFVSGKAGDLCYERYGLYYTASDVVHTLQNVLLWCDTF